MTSRGLACVGQDEVILLVEILPDETRIPKDVLIYINQLYLEAIKGNLIYRIYRYINYINLSNISIITQYYLHSTLQ